MCVLKNCCCCVDLRIGAIVIAILGVVDGIGAFFTINEGVGYDGLTTIQYIFMCLGGAVKIIAGLCLLFGSIKYHQPTTLAYLVLNMISIHFVVIGCAIGLIQSTGGIYIGYFNGLFYISYILVIFSTEIILNIYFWICIFSLYKGLKSGDIRSADSYSMVE